MKNNHEIWQCDSGPLEFRIVDVVALDVEPDKISNHARQEIEEREHLARFIEAYQGVTGETLVNLDSTKGERPDFICEGCGGVRIGVELTEVPHKELLVWDRIFNPGMVAEASDVINTIRGAVLKKEENRAKGGWRPADKLILVITLEVYAFDSLHWLTDDELHEDFQDTGFAEIWLCDNSTINAHGASQLIGFFPEEIWGLHRPRDFDPKPFG